MIFEVKNKNLLAHTNRLMLSYFVQVSDFGLAKSFSDTSASSTHISTRVVGTFGYGHVFSSDIFVCLG
jgi:hypothetical protein